MDKHSYVSILVKVKIDFVKSIRTFSVTVEVLYLKPVILTDLLVLLFTE